jgi:hypothetical protein
VRPVGRFTVRRVGLDETRVLEEIYRVRVLAWAASPVALEITGDQWSDPVDQRAMHWAAFDGSKVVAAARLSFHDTLGDVPEHEMYEGLDIPTPVASFNRLVILPVARGSGLARGMDEERLGAVIEFNRQTKRAASSIIGYCFDHRARALEVQGWKRLQQRPSPKRMTGAPRQWIMCLPV